MNPLFETAVEVQAFIEGRGWRFAFIGGIAVLRWGEPIATQDVDVALLTGFGHEKTYVDALLARFASRVPDPTGFALRNRVLLLKGSNGVAIDVSLAAIPFEEQMVARSTAHTFSPGVDLRTCGAEDLVVLKAFAGRSKDWAAVETIVARHGAVLDWTWIESHLRPLCELKEDRQSVDRLLRLRSERPGD